MNLISCNECGVILDRGKLNFADKNHMHKDDGTIDDSKATWDGSEYVAYVLCPVCGEEIL